MRARLSSRAARGLAALCALAALASAPGIDAHEGGAASDHVAGTQVLPGVGDAPPSRPERIERPIHGRATRVYDGDSFVLLAADGRRLQVRISGIDAPEKGQAFADRSRRHLSELLVQQDLLITPIKTDVYGRVVAVVSAGEQDIGLAQLRAGLAWHFLRYARDQSVEQRQAYARAEAAAREAGVGLWRDREPLEPWRFREKQRERKERRLEDRAEGRPTAIVRSDPLAARPHGRRRLGSATA